MGPIYKTDCRRLITRIAYGHKSACNSYCNFFYLSLAITVFFIVLFLIFTLVEFKSNTAYYATVSLIFAEHTKTRSRGAKNRKHFNLPKYKTSYYPLVLWFSKTQTLEGKCSAGAKIVLRNLEQVWPDIPIYGCG